MKCDLLWINESGLKHNFSYILPHTTHKTKFKYSFEISKLFLYFAIFSAT